MGILLYGVPGTGKTMFAKAIAGELGAPIFPVKCSDIASRYFGDSEKNISNLFAEARKYETAIIFFDEFEALGSSRDDSSSPMKRIVPELLTQMQGFEENPNNLILIAASNRPWEIDSAFIRTGRFSNHIMVPLPDKAARRVIVTNALKGIKISPQDLERIIEASEGYSGADLALQGGLCEKMKDCSIRRRLADGTPDSTEPEIIQSDIEAAFKLARKSVKQSDLDRIREFYLSEHL
ncbi:MAG: ATP-binding protein [Candidatus Enteromonas sp.]|nr:ATP-binding protein [Candidatus Enteromonas sp.]